MDTQETYADQEIDAASRLPSILQQKLELKRAPSSDLVNENELGDENFQYEEEEEYY